MKKFEIDLKNKLFRKFIPAVKFQNEIEMNQRARIIADFSKLFELPNIRKVDHVNHVIEFELIEHSITFRQFYISNSKFGLSVAQKKLLVSHFEQLGRSLAAIHLGSAKSDSAKKRIFPKDFFDKRFDKDLVFIHGDFTMRNILVIDSNEKPIIIDWNISPLFDFSANVGPRYWDISFFISSLFLFSPTTFFSYKSKVELAKSFLLAYLETAEINMQTFANELKDFLSDYHYYKLYGSKLKQNSFCKNYIQDYSIKKLEKFIKQIPELLA